MSTVERCCITALFGVVLATDKHENVLRYLIDCTLIVDHLIFCPHRVNTTGQKSSHFRGFPGFSDQVLISSWIDEWIAGFGIVNQISVGS